MKKIILNQEQAIQIQCGDCCLDGLLYLPNQAVGLVLFAHGSGSSRFSTRNQYVAKKLNEVALATLLFDLLTAEEESLDRKKAQLRFDIAFLASRLIAASQWCQKQLQLKTLKMGYFGASTGAAAALFAAASLAGVDAIVSRGGRPDLAGAALAAVQAPTLLIVGGEDKLVIELNDEALQKLNCIKQSKIVPGATHLFSEPGTLENVSELSKDWFLKYLSHGRP